RHTRLVSDWSSDVCSSDLRARGGTRTGCSSTSTRRRISCTRRTSFRCPDDSRVVCPASRVAAMRSGAILSAALVAASCAPPARVAAPPSPVMTRAVFRASADSLVNDPMFRNTNWGVLIVDPATGDTLYSHNAGRLFMPASNQKLLTSSTALAQLGADYRFATHFVSSAPIVDRVLRGDLLVFGRGDPTMSDAMMGDAMKPLRAAADSLRARGV